MPNKSLQAVLKEYNQYLSLGSDRTNPFYFKTGLVGLNYILADNNGKGLPGSSIIQLIGDPKNGKSTLSLDIVANFQKSNPNDIDWNGKKINALMLDFERSFDKDYASMIGVDTDKLLIVRTPYAEQSFSIAEHLLQEGIQCVLVDSISMTVSQTEEDKDYDDNEKIAAEAKTIGRFLRRCNALIDERSLIILVNQYRSNLSPMARTERKPYGARIIQYVIKASIELRRIKNEEFRTTVEALVSKTKFGAEGRKCTFDIEFGRGIDYAGHILDLALQFGIVEKRGAWYYYGDLKANGADNAKQTFDFDKIRAAVINYMEKES